MTIKLHENKVNATIINDEQLKWELKQFDLFHFRKFNKNAPTPQLYQKIKDFKNNEEKLSGKQTRATHLLY